MKIITMIIFLMLAGCSDYDEVIQITDNNCTTESKDERASFILQCVESANPKSDEEPEDWLRICQGMAEDTYCDKALFDVVKRCDGGPGKLCFERSRSLSKNNG